MESMEHCSNENKNYSSLSVRGDGACLFYSLSYFLFNKSIEHAYDLRIQCCDYIINNSHIFSSFIDSLSINDYVTRLRNPRHYGDHIEIFCISSLYKINIWIYERDHNDPSLIKIRSKVTSPLASTHSFSVKLLFLEDALHYEPLVEDIEEIIPVQENVAEINCEPLVEDLEEIISGPSPVSCSATENPTEIVPAPVINFAFSILSLMALLPYDENKIREHSLVLMNEICKFCGALYFSSEKLTVKPAFHKCCMEGKYFFRFIVCENCGVMYPQTRVIDLYGLCQNCYREMSNVLDTGIDNDILKSILFSREIIPTVQRIKTLLFNEDGSNSKNFREYIRQFNSVLAFASFGASIKAGGVAGRGPYSFKSSGNYIYIIYPLIYRVPKMRIKNSHSFILLIPT